MAILKATASSASKEWHVVNMHSQIEWKGLEGPDCSMTVIKFITNRTFTFGVMSLLQLKLKTSGSSTILGCAIESFVAHVRTILDV